VPVTELSALIRSRQVGSMELTELYLGRLRRFDPLLKCIVMLTERTAHEQAEKADAELAAGIYRGPLHGISWGAKDLMPTPATRPRGVRRRSRSGSSTRRPRLPPGLRRPGRCSKIVGRIVDGSGDNAERLNRLEESCSVHRRSLKKSLTERAQLFRAMTGGWEFLPLHSTLTQGSAFGGEGGRHRRHRLG
jgi:hypothetical protein